jgi:hypothetical protein
MLKVALETGRNKIKAGQDKKMTAPKYYLWRRKIISRGPAGPLFF